MTRTRLVVTVVGWSTLCAALLVSDAHPAAVTLAGVFAVSLAAVSIVLDAARGVARSPWRPPRPTSHATAGDDPRVVAVSRHLLAERTTDSTAIDDRLIALVDARLLSGFDVDRHADPRAADAVLPPALRALVARPRGAPRSRRSRRRDLHRLLAELEAM